MKTYTISYEKKGKKVTGLSKGKNAQDAMLNYAHRLVFDKYPMFVNVSTKNIDADTRGEKWGIFKCDDITVNVDIK